MNKIKSPLVKRLRKAGYSCKQAMRLTNQIYWNHKSSQLGVGLGFINKWPIAQGRIYALFVWEYTEEGHIFWSGVNDQLRHGY